MSTEEGGGGRRGGAIDGTKHPVLPAADGSRCMNVPPKKPPSKGDVDIMVEEYGAKFGVPIVVRDDVS